MKHKFSCTGLLLVSVALVACGEIDDVRGKDGICTDPFIAAYNNLGDEFEALQKIELASERKTQLEKVDETCENFFSAFEEQVACNALRNGQEVSVKGDDYTTLCSRPALVGEKSKIPLEIE